MHRRVAVVSDLDAVPVGVENLDPYEPAVILPFRLGNTRNTKALAHRSHCIGVDKAKAKVVGTGKCCSNRCALGERQLRPVIRTHGDRIKTGAAPREFGIPPPVSDSAPEDGAFMEQSGRKQWQPVANR